MDTFENSVQRNCVDNTTLNSLELRTELLHSLISVFTFLMSSVVMYRSNSDHNVVCRDIWFHIKPNLCPFLGHF